MRRLLIVLGLLVLGAGAGGVAGAAGRHPTPRHRATPQRRCRVVHHHRRCVLIKPVRHRPAPKPHPLPPVTSTVAPTPLGAPPPPTSTTTPPALPSRLEVDEQEYTVTPSYTTVAAGSIQFNAVNYGQDQHVLAVADASGHVLASTGLIDPGSGTATLTATLPPGTYRLECTLLDHLSRGMLATVTVR